MDLERQHRPPQRRGISLPARVALGALAIFGAFTLLQWVVTALVGTIKFALLVVVVLAVGAWIIGAKGSR